MQTFSQVIFESRISKKLTTSNLTITEIDNYVSKVKRQLPKSVLDVIYLTKRYNLLEGEVINTIINTPKSNLEKMSERLDISFDELVSLQKQLIALKNDVRLLPQLQSLTEREDMMSGKIKAIDLTLDLSTEAGRNAAAKQYTNYVYSIVNNYIGKSSLDRADLISAAMLGLADAIKTYDPEKSDMTFKSFASNKISLAILNDMNLYSHSLSGTNWYANKHYGDKLDAVSIDSLRGTDDDSDYNTDHLGALGASDDLRWIDLTKSEQEYWESLYKIIDSKFTVKERNIFYRYFGLGDFWGKKEKSKDIAKSYGMSEGNIRNSVINKILKFLKNDPKSRNILASLQTIYNESLMKDLVYYTDKQAIYEALINDDMFILLEELNKWNNKTVFKNSITGALNNLSTEDSLYIIKCLTEGFNFIDDTYKKHKQTITGFLKYVYPTETFNKLSDVSIINYLVELSDISKEHNIEW